MSDDAADKTNTSAEKSAQVDQPQDSTEADVTAKASADEAAESAAAESAAAPGDAADAGKTEAAAADDAATAKVDSAKADSDKTVKLPAAAPAEDATVKLESAAASQSGAEPTVKLPTAAANSVAAAPAGSEGGKRGWVPIAGAFAAGVVVVAAAAAVTWFGLQDHDRGKQLSARDSAVAAACDFGRQVGTYESKNFDDYVKRVKDRSAGDWLTQFDGASTALKQITQQAQASSSVSEIHCAWESGGSDKASVVMLITQIQSKAATPQPQHLTIGVVASLEKKDGKWLVDNFQSPMTQDMQNNAPAPGANTAPAPGDSQQPGN
ncbi:hypothetical protein KO481_00540 [Nocardia sp. NEAU-G5]|uniref:Mce-associated membrane protein n=1 Tax=Nocardia albiluteola TaxID=2842303 RepID=A0ABS6APT3_9NOCA|nr:hypothetical protein [Nocardia albiluteola]MBU3060019.1 hypothetical protein [Nocardia albiluteola]